jgi:hypothetical protein
MNIDDMLPPRPPGLTDEEWLDLKIELLELCEREGILEHTGEYEVSTLDGRLLKVYVRTENPTHERLTTIRH